MTACFLFGWGFSCKLQWVVLVLEALGLVRFGGVGVAAFYFTFFFGFFSFG